MPRARVIQTQQAREELATAIQRFRSIHWEPENADMAGVWGEELAQAAIRYLSITTTIKQARKHRVLDFIVV